MAKDAVQLMISRRTVAGIHRHRKVAQRRLLSTLVLLLAAVRSVSASNCVLLAKDADTVLPNANEYTGRRSTSSSAVFGLQKGNVGQPTVLALVLLHNLRKQADFEGEIG